MRFAPVPALLVFTLVALVLAPSVLASPWYPIDTGRMWVYDTDRGETVRATMGPTELFAGASVRSMRWDRGSQEHLSSDDDGRVLLHGVTAPDDAYTVFRPAILRMDTALEVGHTWETVSEATTYRPGGLVLRRERVHWTYEVLAFPTVEVAAGSFSSVQILVTLEITPWEEGVDTHGRRIRVAHRDHHAQGVGWIRRAAELGGPAIFALRAYGVAGVRTEPSSWGAVKAQYEQ